MLIWSPRIAPNRVRKNVLKSLSPALFIVWVPAQATEIVRLLGRSQKIVGCHENGWCPWQGLNRVTADLHQGTGENPPTRWKPARSKFAMSGHQKIIIHT